MNVDGMLPYENEVADYIKSTGNHVLYRVTPVFEDDNLLASGVLMEAESVEDGGSGVSFNAYCYNVQPGISIDYATGDSSGQAYTGSEASKYDGVDFQSPAVIKAVQQALNDKGYDCGTPDGIAGSGTASAAAHFKADHGLSGDGIDAALALTLGLNAYQLRADARAERLPAAGPELRSCSRSGIRNAGRTGLRHSRSGIRRTGRGGIRKRVDRTCNKLHRQYKYREVSQSGMQLDRPDVRFQQDGIHRLQG